MADRPIFPDTIKNAGLLIEPADTTTAQAIVTAGTNGARITSISIVSDDTADMVVDITYYDGATDFLLGSVPVPLGSGTDGVLPSVSVFESTLMPFLGTDLAFYLEGTDAIRAAVQTTVTTAKTVTLVAQYGDY